MKLTMKAEVPVGEYLGRLSKVEEWTENSEKYGDGIRFAWEILKGEYEGQEVSRITGTKVSKKTALGKLLVGLKGSLIEPGEEVDPTTFVGREYLLVVGETDNGSTRVETVISNPAG